MFTDFALDSTANNHFRSKPRIKSLPIAAAKLPSQASRPSRAITKRQTKMPARRCANIYGGWYNVSQAEYALKRTPALHDVPSSLLSHARASHSSQAATSQAYPEQQPTRQTDWIFTHDDKYYPPTRLRVIQRFPTNNQ